MTLFATNDPSKEILKDDQPKMPNLFEINTTTLPGSKRYSDISRKLDEV